MKKLFTIKTALIIMVGALFVANLFLLDKYNIWRDEAFSINVAQQSISEIGGIVAKDVHPPLHLYILHFWMQLFGDSVFSVRLLSLLIALGIPVVGFKLAQELFPGKSKTTQAYQAFAVLMIVSTPFFLLQAIEARAYSMLMLAEIGVIYAVIKSLEFKSFNKFDIAFILFAVLGLYSHVIFLFSFFAVFIWNVALFARKVYTEKLKKPEVLQLLGKYFLVYAAVGLAFLPWVSQLIRQILQVSTQGFWLQFNPAQDLINSFQQFFITTNMNEDLHSFTPFVKYFLSIFGPVLLLLGAFRAKQKYYLGGLILLTLGLVFVASFKNPIYYIRYIAFLVPGILLVVLDALYSIRNGLSKAVVSAIVLVFVSANLYVFYGNIMQDPHLKADYTKAISHIRSTAPEAQIVHPNGYTLHSFIYYSDKMEIDPGKLYDPQRQNPHFEGLAAFSDENYYDQEFPGELDKVWVPFLYNNEPFNDILRKNGYQVIDSKSFNGGLQLQLWKRSAL